MRIDLSRPNWESRSEYRSVKIYEWVREVWDISGEFFLRDEFVNKAVNMGVSALIRMSESAPVSIYMQWANNGRSSVNFDAQIFDNLKLARNIVLEFSANGDKTIEEELERIGIAEANYGKKAAEQFERFLRDVPNMAEARLTTRRNLAEPAKIIIK